MAAIAAPPFMHDTNRNAVRSLTVADCDDERCRGLQAGETYDLKGNHQYSGLYLSERSGIDGVSSCRG